MASSDSLQQSPVLTSFASTRNASVQETEWNLLATPLICGSLAIMDNMITDNLQLMQAVGKGHIREVMQRYSKAGLFKLYHRAQGQNIKRITRLSDVFLDWLTRDKVETVGFGMLSDVQNGKLRDLIVSFNDHHTPHPKRLKPFYRFMSECIPGYGEYIEQLNAIFDEAPGSSSSYQYRPKDIQYRLLSCIGFSDQPEALIARTANKSVKAFKEALLNQLPDIEHKLFTRDQLTEMLETETYDGFFEKLNMQDDPTLTGLLESLENVNSALRPVWCKLLLEVYTSGIPEANGGRVLLENETLSRGPDINFKKLSELITGIDLETKQQLARVDLWHKGKPHSDHLQELRGELFDTSVPLINDDTQVRINTYVKKYGSPVAAALHYGTGLFLPESCTMIQHSAEATAEAINNFELNVTYKVKLSEGKLYGSLPGDFTTRAHMLIDRIGIKTFD